MKHTLLLALIMFFQTVFAQDKCKYEKNEIDQFTKSKNVVTEWTDFNGSAEIHASVKLQRSDNNYILFFACNFTTSIKDGMSVDKGQEVIILLESGDTVLSHSNESIQCVTKYRPSFNGNFDAEVHTNCNLSSEQITKIKSSPLKSIRVYMKLPTNAVSKCDLPPKKKKVNVLIDLITCIENS